MKRFVRMFQHRFVHSILDGSKCQTIRSIPKLMPLSWDLIDCRTLSGTPYASKQVRLGCFKISSVYPCEVTVDAVYIAECLDIITHTGGAIERFAKADGFASWDEMREWFDKTHGLPFRGILIKWDPKPI